MQISSERIRQLFDDAPTETNVTDPSNGSPAYDPAHVILNPQTAALVDLNDQSPAGIDRICECRRELALMIGRLSSQRFLCDRAIEAVAAKNLGKSRTVYVQGAREKAKVEFPGRKFNNAQLKVVWAMLDTNVAIAGVEETHSAHVAMMKRRREVRDNLLRITDVAVNLRPFDQAERTEGDEFLSMVVTKIRGAEEKTNNVPASVSVEDKT
jgi:hypothetical protein